MTDFKKLLVWQKAHVLAKRVTEVADRFARRHPTLAKQITEAADSVMATIAEGRGRSTDRDFANFISMAIGSVTEVENHLQRAFDHNYITEQEFQELTDAAIEVRKMLIGLRKRLRGK